MLSLAEMTVFMTNQVSLPIHVSCVTKCPTECLTNCQTDVEVPNLGLVFMDADMAAILADQAQKTLKLCPLSDRCAPYVTEMPVV